MNDREPDHAINTLSTCNCNIQNMHLTISQQANALQHVLDDDRLEDVQLTRMSIVGPLWERDTELPHLELAV